MACNRRANPRRAVLSVRRAGRLRDLIAAGRDNEIEEIHRYISPIVPDAPPNQRRRSGWTRKPQTPRKRTRRLPACPRGLPLAAHMPALIPDPPNRLRTAGDRGSFRASPRTIGSDTNVAFPFS